MVEKTRKYKKGRRSKGVGREVNMKKKKRGAEKER